MYRLGITRFAVFFVSGLTVIAFVVRLALAMKGGLWRDEALFLAIVRLPTWSEMFAFVRFHESHPPLFYVVMRLWTQLFGDGDFAGVILPVIFGAALIPTLFVVGRSLFNEETGIVAASFAALSPILTEYSAVARPYSLIPLLALLSTFALIRGLHQTTKSVLVAYVGATTALVYTHNWTWLIILGQWLAVAILLIGSKVPSRFARVRWWLVAQCCVLVAFAPWLPTFQFQARNAGHGPALLSLYESPFLAVVGGVRQLLDSTILAALPIRIDNPWIELLLAMPLLFLTLTQYFVIRGRRNAGTYTPPMEKTIQLTCLLVIPVGAWMAALILSSRSELLLARCLVSLAPMVVLAVSYWLVRLLSGPARMPALASIGALLITYVLCLSALLGTTRSNAREIASAVRHQTLPFDAVIVSPEWLASSFNRYYSPTVEQIDYPVMKRENTVDFTHVLERFRSDSALYSVFDFLDRSRRGGRRVWLIVDGRRKPIEKPSTLQSLLTSDNYTLVAAGRSYQLRAKLDSLYGEPVDTRISADPPRYERLHAFLYAPR
jgi:4-amino-4-deoxy-L-arabinose transferase-like glycosyltransferase